MLRRGSRGFARQELAMAATQAAKPAEPAPIFRRPTPRDALGLAREAFLEGTRVEIGVLAAQLSISRVTLYRWFGSREQLLEQLLVGLAGEFTAPARAAATGDGDERVVDFARRIMDATADFEPLRMFVEREPQLALRLLIGESGAVHRAIAEALLEVIAETHSPEQTTALDKRVHAIVRMATALQWSTLAIGEEPETELAVDIVRVLLANGRAATPRSH
jgi:AcrR family transcriptional regulator